MIMGRTYWAVFRLLCAVCVRCAACIHAGSHAGMLISRLGELLRGAPVLVFFFGAACGEMFIISSRRGWFVMKRLSEGSADYMASVISKTPPMAKEGGRFRRVGRHHRDNLPQQGDYADNCYAGIVETALWLSCRHKLVLCLVGAAPRFSAAIIGADAAPICTTGVGA